MAPVRPLTALFRSSLSPSCPSSAISALPDIPADSTTPPHSPPPTTTTPEHRSIPKEKKRKEPIVGLAFDHMNIRLGDFWKLRTYLPAMDQAFGKDEKDEDEGSEERILEKMNE